MRKLLEHAGMEALLVNKPENIFYLSGFTAGVDACLLITMDRQCLITDGRYMEQAKSECAQWQIIEDHLPLSQTLPELTSGCAALAVESNYVNQRRYKQLELMLPQTELRDAGDIVELLRMVKDEGELEILRANAAISDKVFSCILGHIAAGRTEKEMADEIMFSLRRLGCINEAFPTIVLSGANTQFPHGHPSDKKIAGGDMITMDFGGIRQGYVADMTRTVVVSPVNNRIRDVYNAVAEAQALGVSIVRSGARCADIDAAVRKCLTKYGLGDYFVHSSGHGIGLEIHENPTLSERSEAILQTGMTVTIEPGVYLPGWGGIRIEDSVIVKDNGCEVMAKSDKNLIIL